MLTSCKWWGGKFLLLSLHGDFSLGKGSGKDGWLEIR
jgi:hypothetical protein